MMMIRAALRFPFRGANVWTNIGCLLVCFLIPIVGPIVAMGYLVGVEKRLIENMEVDAPKFDFGKFSFYLQRGLQPFLASLLISLAIIPVVLVLMGGLVLAAIVLQKQPGLMGLVIALGGLVYVGTMLLFGTLVGALVFKAGLEGKFAAAFDKAFAVDYFKRVGLLTIGVNLLLMLVLMPVMLVSVCVPFIGMYAVTAFGIFVQAHVRVQLYLEYLKRGGRVIVFVPEEVASGAFPVVVPPPLP